VLQKDRHPNLDFFVADLFSWPVKDDQASMEHPFFSLAKNSPTVIRYYEHNGNSIISPSNKVSRFLSETPSVGMPGLMTRVLSKRSLRNG